MFLQPSNRATLSELKTGTANLLKLWTSEAAYGCLLAAEIFSPDYRRTAAEICIADPNLSAAKRRELHLQRQKISAAIHSSQKLYDQLLNKTLEYIKENRQLNPIQKVQFDNLVLLLKEFIEKMQAAEDSSKSSAEERPALVDSCRELILNSEGSDLQKESQISLLEERERSISHLLEVSNIEASFQNNAKMIEKIQSLLKLLQLLAK